MELNIKGNPEEIAALVLAVQERPGKIFNYHLDSPEVIGENVEEIPELLKILRG